MNSENIQKEGVPPDQGLQTTLANVLDVLKAACTNDNLRVEEAELLLEPMNEIKTRILANSIERSSNLATFFFTTFTTGVLKALLEQRTTREQQVTDAMYEIFKIFLEIFVAQIPRDNMDYTETVKRLFEHDSPFFNCHYNNVRATDTIGIQHEFWKRSFTKALANRDLNVLLSFHRGLPKEEEKLEEQSTDAKTEEGSEGDASSTNAAHSDQQEDLVSAIHGHAKPDAYAPSKIKFQVNPYESAISEATSFEIMAQWFNALDEGQLVDALKFQDTYKARAWSRAKLTKSRKSGYVKLQFINDNTHSHRDIRLKDLATTVLSGEADIAPIGTRSKDFEWRESLQKGDLIDCYDTASVWYRSTILARKELNLGEGKMIQVHVAFRIYTQKGVKTDAEGRKYMGWHSKYDEWISVHSPRIQKIGYMSKKWTEHSSARGFNEDAKTVDDNQDVALEFGDPEIDSQLFAVVRRNSLKSKICVSLINYFGSLGGYDKILERIKDEAHPTSFEQLALFAEILGAAHTLYHKRFTFNYVFQLRESIPQQALAMMKQPKLIRELKKERLEKLLGAYENLLKRILVMEDRIYYCERLSLDLHLLWIKSEFMSKRIFGLKHLEEYARNTRLYKRNAVEQDQLVNWIVKNNIIEEIFNPVRTHEELIKRSLEILKLFSSYSMGSSQHSVMAAPTRKKLEIENVEKDPFEYVVDPMWECAQSDPQFKLEIYKIFNDAQSVFHQEHHEYLTQKLANLPVNLFTVKDIDLITEVVRTSSRLTESSLACAGRLWELATATTGGDLREAASKNICDLLRHYEWRKVRFGYIRDCVQLIKDRNSVSVALKILTKLLESLSSAKSYHPGADSHTRFSMLESLDQESQLTESLFQELEDYYKKLVAKTGERIATESMTIQTGETHRSSLEARLSFIKFVFQNSSTLRMNREQLDKLWEILMVKSPVASDRDFLFRILKEAAEHSLKHGEAASSTQVENQAILNIEDLVALYREKMVPMGGDGGALDLAFIRQEGFLCLQVLFVLVNEREGRLMKVEQKKYYQNTFYGGASHYHAQTYSVSHVESKAEANQVYFKIQTHPHELEGLELFWKILLTSHDEQLAAKAHLLLIRTFTSLSPELLEQSHELYREIIGECFKMLEKQVKKEASRKEVIRILDLVTLIMKESEKKGVGSVRPHSGLLREQIVTLKIHNQCTTTKQIPNKFLMRLYSNTTMSEISSELSKILRTTAKDLKITRTKTNSDIDEHDNAKTLNDLGFEENEGLVLQRRASYSTEHASLMTKNKDLAPAAKKIFSEWFAEYADEVGVDGRKQMTMKGAADFTSSCTHERCFENDDRIQTLFNTYDSNHDGRLELDDFLEFYRVRAQSHDHVVWNNLNYKGYGSDLTREGDGGKRVKEDDLPRVFIVRDPDYFKLLLKVHESDDADISSAAWNLINQLATSQTLYQQILNLDVERDAEVGLLQWAKLIPTENTAQLLYTLQIIEFFIEEPPDLGQATLVLDEDASKKKEAPPDLEKSSSEPDMSDELKHQSSQEASDMYKTPPPKKPVARGEAVSAIPAIESAKKLDDQELAVWTYAGISANAGENELSARKEWRLRFFQEGGFNYLFDLLMDEAFFKPERLLKTDISETKYVLKILSALIRIIKIYLAAAFSAQSESLHDVVSLVRRTSSQAGEKEEKGVIEFEELVSQLRGSAAQELLMVVNFSKLQRVLLRTLGTVVEGRKDMNFEERSIIESGLGLWVHCVLFKPAQLFKEFMQFGDQSKASSSPLRSSESFVMETLFTYKSRQVRREFMKAFLALSTNTPLSTEAENHPLIYFLKLLIAHIPREYNIFRRECKDFYELLRLLIEEYYAKSTSFLLQDAPLDADSLIAQVLESFNDYEPKERRGTYIQDQTLIGFLELLATIAKKSPEALNNPNGRTLLLNTFQNCLFPAVYPSIEGDVTGETDLLAPELTPNKCKTKESREAAFQLLLALAEISPEMMEELLQLIANVTEKAPVQNGWGYVPGNKVRSQEGYVGIQNLGATCYMNAMLQQFFMIPSFRYSMLQIEDGVDPELKQYKGRKEDDNVLHQLQKIFIHLELSEKRAYNPLGFCFAFKDYEGNPTNTAIQSDAQEFLNMAFERLEAITKPTHQKWLLPCMFGGRVCEQLTCKRCGYVRNNFQDYYNLSLEVKNLPSLHKSLEKFVAGETISDFMCEECHQKSEVQKRTCLADLPNILIIHLQRIIFNFDTFVQEKVSSRFEFPRALDLRPYTLDHLRQEDKAARAKKVPEEEKKQEGAEEVQEEEVSEGEIPTVETDPCYEYKLVGVVLHQGPSAESGHYISYINTERGDPAVKKARQAGYDFMATESEKWLEFNDAVVKHFPFSSLETECFGSNAYSVTSPSVFSDDNYYQGSGFTSDTDTRRCAYMLVYERARKKDLKVVINEKEADEVENQRQELDKMLKEAADSGSVLQRLKAEQKVEKAPPLPTVKRDSETEQIHKLVNFYAVPRFIKGKEARAVWDDNNEFLFHEYYLYQQEYFDFIKNLMTTAWQTAQARKLPNDNESSPIQRLVMHIAGHAIFRLLAKSTNNNQIVDISDVLAQVLLERGEVAQEFMLNFVLDSQGAGYAHELFLQAPDKQVRKNVGKVITACVNSLFKHEQAYLQEEEVQISQEQRGDETVQIQIRSPKALCVRYLNIITGLIRKGDIVKNWLRFDEFFAFLADVAQGGEAQRKYLMTNQYIALLLDLYLGQNSPLCPPEVKRQTIGNSYAKPNFSNLFETVTKLISGNDSPLSEADKACLLDKHFFRKAIKQNKEVAGCLVPLIVLQSTDNFENSKHIAKVLLRAVNDADYESISGILEILEPFLLLEDSLQQQRLQWIYGFPTTSVRSSAISINYDYGGSTVSNTSSSSGNNLPSVGISQNPSFVPDAHTYYSPLSKITTMQSYCSVLFSKRTRQETCAMLMMVSMWQLSMKNPVIRDYIFSLPPPNYDFGSYPDWWFRVASAFITETKRYKYSTTRSSTGACAESLIDDVKETLAVWKMEKLSKLPKQQSLSLNIEKQYENVFQRPYMVDYVVIRATKVVQVHESQIEREETGIALSRSLRGSRKELVTLTVSRVEGEILEPSLPNGSRNLAISQYSNNRGLYGGHTSTFGRGIGAQGQSNAGLSSPARDQSKSTNIHGLHGSGGGSSSKKRKQRYKDQKNKQSEDREKEKTKKWKKVVGSSLPSQEIEDLPGDLGGDFDVDHPDIHPMYGAFGQRLRDHTSSRGRELKHLSEEEEDQNTFTAPLEESKPEEPPTYDLLDQDSSQAAGQQQEPQPQPEEPQNDNKREEEKRDKRVQKMPIRHTKQFKFESSKGDVPLITVSETPPQNVYEIAERQEGLYLSSSSSQEGKEEENEEEESEEEEKKVEGEVSADRTFMLRISVLNQTSEAQKVKMMIKHANPERAWNVWVPESAINSTVQDRHQRHVLYLIVREPHLYDEKEDALVVEWSTADNSETIKAGKRLAKREARNLSHLLHPQEEVVVPEEPAAEAAGDNDGTPAGGGETAPKGMKNCRACTMFIAESAKKCHVCDTMQ